MSNKTAVSRKRIKELLQAAAPRDLVSIKGWVRSRRDAKDFSFLVINDGSCLASLQAIIDVDCEGHHQLKDIGTGSAVAVDGALVESPGGGQAWELKAVRLELLGGVAEDYPLQKKRHGDEFLRGIAHLRPRTNKYGAMFRIRSRLSQAIHDFFQSRGFSWIHTPILTGSDCEGAGETFQVTTLDLAAPPTQEGRIDYGADFFGKPAQLTVSGQLSVEMFCLGLGDVYTFGPTFRAENSNTSRHVAEFWMIEPEMAFADLEDDMQLGETFIRELTRFAIDECREDLDLFAKFVDKELLNTLDNVIGQDFARVTYDEAIDILDKAGGKFEFTPAWGADLQAEHERFLTEVHFKRPVIVYDYPKDIKAFYMRLNDDDKTVAAMDILVPRIGELIGGSQREERYEVLRKRIEELGFDEQDYWWYLDSRRHGSVPHCGFGLGFERLLMLITGVTNIRDVIPFPRTPKHLEF
jgi:asparaginyl-tRNA synthetase